MRLPTANRYGAHFTKVWGPIEQFIAFSSAYPTEWSLDLGCAWGGHSLKALYAGARIIANDLDPRHLQQLVTMVPSDLRKNLQVRVGRFQSVDLPLLCAVLCANVFCFMTDAVIRKSLAKMHKSLRCGGRIFVVTPAPFDGKNGQLPVTKVFGRNLSGAIDRNLTFNLLGIRRLSFLFVEARFTILSARYRYGNANGQKLTAIIAERGGKQL